MKNKALQKNNIREIFRSKARFISILGIILLGVCFYAGIKGTGPDMIKTVDTYYSNKNLMDTKITSTLGIGQKDIDILEKYKNISDFEASYSKDISLSKENKVVRFFSYDLKKSKHINEYEIVKGRLPKKSGEIALDNRVDSYKKYQIGNDFKFSKEDEIGSDFKTNTYKIVGFVNSPMYIENISRGNTNIGKGYIDYFAVIAKEDFKMKFYTEIYIKYKDTNKEQSYSKAYDEKLASNEDKLKLLFKDRPKNRLAEIKNQALTAIKYSKKAVEEGEKNKLQALKEPTYYFLNRKDNPGYVEFNENAKRISSIATVFPVFFFMIAALVCLTTMTRMVDEKRGEIGTLKGLGYTNWEISQKYIIYATSASLIGSLLGLLIGFNVFPAVIFDAYGTLYNLPPIIIQYYWSYSIQSVVVSIICTLISALVVLKVDLLSLPANLMRPKAPKAGQRIFLEKITFIWGKLNFNQKVTARNLFRYKQRMLMTVLGIAGCMALIVTGFGLRDSIGDVVDLQFNKLWHYKGIVTYNKDATEKEDKSYQNKLASIPNYKDKITLSKESMKVIKEGVNAQEITVDVPKTRENLDKFILFNNRKTGEKHKLTDNGAIINEKLAKLFKLKEGDSFIVLNNDNKKFTLKVHKIVENYAMNFVYVTPVYYEKVFNKKPQYNSDLILFKKDITKNEENKISKELMECNKVINVSFLSKTSSAMKDSINSLNIVMWVLIISAGTLAFIVLYNLNNINISERIRELSTIKVLGFYDNEVTMYVYRENNILTTFGILLGCIVGKLFHGFVLQTAEVDMLMFSPNIHIISYVYSALITILFSLIVMAVMHLKLYKVNMIEALKSNE
ncbi:FtsX-like permease family protein [Haloimpatiens sp. FM7315]|uniref:FtsX-like permease family protein n=1 Tax=Haloimpatiens sp. FM7315 TaxID=3298609 RepID=UPI0035A32105